MTKVTSKIVHTQKKKKKKRAMVKEKKKIDIWNNVKQSGRDVSRYFQLLITLSIWKKFVIRLHLSDLNCLHPSRSLATVSI